MKDEEIKALIHEAVELQKVFHNMIDDEKAKGNMEPPEVGTPLMAMFTATVGAFLLLMGKIIQELLRRDLKIFPEMQLIELRSVVTGMFVGGLDIMGAMDFPEDEKKHAFDMATGVLKSAQAMQKAMARPAMDAAQAHMNEIVDKIFMEGGPIHEA